MTLPNSGRLGLSNIQSEFGGGNPANISEYYRGGRYVPNASTNNSIPTGGKIDISDFYGTSNIITNTFSTGYSHSTQRENDYRGYRRWATISPRVSKMSISWSCRFIFRGGHWNGNVSQCLQVRNSGNNVVYSTCINGVLEGPGVRNFTINVSPDTYTFWTNATTRTGPPYGLMQANGSISGTYWYIP